MSLLKKNVRDQTLRWDQAALHNTSQPLSAKLQKPRLNSERYCFSVEFSWHRVYAQKASQHSLEGPNYAHHTVFKILVCGTGAEDSLLNRRRHLATLTTKSALFFNGKGKGRQYSRTAALPLILVRNSDYAIMITEVQCPRILLSRMSGRRSLGPKYFAGTLSRV